MNNNLILVCGKSASGKSMCLRNIPDPKGVLYLNCENNKALPFRSKFRTVNVTDAMDVYDAFDQAEEREDIHTIVIDTATYLMDMFETQYVLNSTNTQKAWGEYAQFFKRLMNEKVANSTKRIVILAHTTDVVSDDGISETLVKVKGSLMDKGIESAFSCVVACKTMPLRKLEKYQNSLLTITPREEELGYKHVFQVTKTKETTGERMRAPLDMWADNETFIDNDIQHYFARLEEYFAEEE